jgi:type I restriction enzyme, R subunit
VEVARSTDKLKTLAQRPGPGLVFATIQKYREPAPGAEYPKQHERLAMDGGQKAAEVDRPSPPKLTQPLRVLNESPDILVLVDEAHRTQAGDLHANLLQALPNCARIGFTGTPIIMGDKKRTHDIFGEFIDRYTIKEAERDGATVPILYEGRTAKGRSRTAPAWTTLFEDLFRERSPEELEAIKKKYATKGQIFEAPRLIEEKAADMLRHYVTHILPNGYKAQVVAYSRRAAIRYQEALEAARKELLAEALALSPKTRRWTTTHAAPPARVQAAIQAWRQRENCCNSSSSPW